MIITITGTPGTGKTFIAKKLAKETKAKYFDLNAFIKNNKLYDSYDEKDETYDVDTEKLKKSIDKIIKPYKENEEGKEKTYLNVKTIKKLSSIIKKHKSIIIDSHLSHFINSNTCIVVKTDIKKLYSRLKKRKYSKSKIEDNIQSEIFDICLEDARKLKRKIIIVNN